MPEIIEVEFHSKYLSDFQLSRLVQASLRKYTVAITAFISDAVIICTTKIHRAWKEGRFWLLETGEGNYLVGSFKRGGGRRNFLELIRWGDRLKSED